MVEMDEFRLTNDISRMHKEIYSIKIANTSSLQDNWDLSVVYEFYLSFVCCAMMVIWSQRIRHIQLSGLLAITMSSRFKTSVWRLSAVF
jgi:hypothetical protein